jgi:hypothetical protein
MYLRSGVVLTQHHLSLGHDLSSKTIESLNQKIVITLIESLNQKIVIMLFVRVLLQLAT